MTTEQKINGLTWHNAINKLKSILKDFLTLNNTVNTSIEGIESDIVVIQNDISTLQENPVDSRPYKSYVALLLGDDVGAPTATILENTLGEDVTITNPQIGEYLFSFETIDTLDVFVPYVPSIQGYTSSIGRNGTSISVNFVDIDNASAAINVSFSNTPIEIRIYN